jgi:PAT family beta-lactamase induction signal transducer AmpG
VIAPFTELVRRLGARRTALVLAFACLYEFGYFFAQALLVPFFRAQGFSNTDIAEVYKAVGLGGLALGGLVAGGLVAKFGVRRMLVAFGALAAATHLLYAALAVIGHSMPMFAVAVLADSIANAMVVATFLAVLMSVVSSAVSATQLALLTSLSSVGLRVFGPFAGTIVAHAGWPWLFVTSAALALPGIALGWFVQPQLVETTSAGAATVNKPASAPTTI